MQILEAKAKMASDPSYRFTYHMLSAELALEQHKAADAVRHYREAARERPKNPKPLADLGYVYLQFLHDTKPVLELYRKAIGLGGSVMIPVRHEHGRGAWCEGTVRIGRDELRYLGDSVTPKGGDTHVSAPGREEVKSFIARAGTPGTMRLDFARYSLDLVPIEQPQAIRELTLTLVKETAPRM